MTYRKARKVWDSDARKKIVSKRLLQYIVAGGSSFTVEYGSFLALYYMAHTTEVVANTISFILSLVTSFTLNKLWVFKSERQTHRFSHQLILYGCVATVNVIVTDIMIHFLVGAGMPAFVAKMILIVLVATSNFFVFKKLIFKPQQNTQQ